MKRYFIFLLSVIFIISCNNRPDTTTESPDTVSSNIPQQVDIEKDTLPGPITLIIHGGAGFVDPEYLKGDVRKNYNDKLSEALNEGYAVLMNGGTSEEAVMTAIQILEESPLFNAGVGAVLNSDGIPELDASIMRGSDLNAGAVAGVSHVKSPIAAAYAVMEMSEHVMMAGQGAEKFIRDQGLEMVDPEYFITDRRRESLKKAKKKEAGNDKFSQAYSDFMNQKFGTVGAVALDKYGVISAGTSTGGMTNKKYGRIGDSPIIGAGTYADNSTCGVSATGHGEYFIRNVVAYDIAARMKYQGTPLADAADEVVMKKLVEMNGSGGIIALDRKGNIAMPFNSKSMFRGYINKKDEPHVYIYKDEEK
ncbi:isoaspartyl peptidase/L-asparaginase family protein [Marinigracilibium pacificum]|uniref:Isoaspartyl peptidase n=1 Tax=Marinigracilibium pacificum TaxID=2729599 RepID=A0A848IVH8_9BACT|nr:isoaspartyl peptidase/L-asparaginase [Marinigracilibium pacificum]NMM47188.1 isoaspartyl peptidase/L-asparaginase [Marinigracilibium pacificum]